MDKKIELAVNAAKKAGEIVLSFYDKPEIKYKESNNLVTQADIEAETYIIKTIKSKFPGHSILSEELVEKDAYDSDNLWIIDPLDGTNNYARNIPQFCISIAYAEKGNVLAGVIYDPCRKELFTSIKGKGAYLNGEKIWVSNKNHINQAIIATGFYYERGEIMEKTLDTIKSLFKQKICGLRRMGSAALDLCWVACGRYDGYFEYKISPWDIAAGMLIVSEAGGFCTDRSGAQLTLNKEGVVATNQILNKKIIDIVKWK